MAKRNEVIEMAKNEMSLKEIIGTEIIGGFGGFDGFPELQIRSKEGKIFNLKVQSGKIVATEQKPIRAAMR